MQGQKIHGKKYRTELADAFSVAWQGMPYLEGAWTNPPYGTSGYELLPRPAGHVYFAGDWLRAMVAWQHGAFWSARDTVSALRRRC